MNILYNNFCLYDTQKDEENAIKYYIEALRNTSEKEEIFNVKLNLSSCYLNKVLFNKYMLNRKNMYNLNCI